MKAICLDFDNTLQDLDSAFEVAVKTIWLPLASRYERDPGDLKPALYECWPLLWQEFIAGTRAAVTLYPEWFHRAFQVLALPLSNSEVDEVVRQYDVVFENALYLYSDVIPTLNRLAGWAEPPGLAILTNGPSERQRHRIKARGLERVIPVWCISEEIGASKPQPEFFWDALRTLDVGPVDAVMIGDDLDTDIIGAKAVGMKAIWLNRHGLESPNQDCADGIATNLIEAIRIIESWSMAPL